MRGSRILAGLVLVSALVVPVQADAQTYLTPDTWFTFSWSSDGTVATTYQASTSTLLVVDCCIVGDMFEVFANGSSVGSTSSVLASDGTDTGAVTGDAAWADSRLSKGMFTVASSDLITLTRTQQAVDFATGDGFIMSQTTVPEPATVILMLSGLAGIGFVGMRRKEKNGIDEA